MYAKLAFSIFIICLTASPLIQCRTFQKRQITFDAGNVISQINSMVGSSNNRGGFVKGVMETAFNGANGRYNVMVFNLNQEYEQHFNGIQLFHTVDYDGITYGVWIFEDGTFDNKGDAGWINWAFQGWFDRNGGHVDFHKP